MRFNKIKHGGWSVSLDKWDAIIFEAVKFVKVYGFGIYAAKDG